MDQLGHVADAVDAAIIPAEFIGAPEHRVFKWLLEAATCFLELFDIVSDAAFIAVLMMLDEEKEEILGGWGVLAFASFALSFIMVNIVTDQKNFGQVHPKVRRVLYTPTDEKDRVPADIVCSPCKCILGVFYTVSRWIANSIFYAIFENIFYLLSFGKYKKGSLALLPLNETEQGVLVAVIIMFVEDIPQFVLQLKIYFDPDLNFLDDGTTRTSLIITSTVTVAHFLITIYNVWQEYKNFGGDSISFEKYMKYILGIQKVDDDIVTAYAQQIETGNFEGRVLNLRNGFITDAGCERLCQALRKQIDENVRNKKSGMSLKYLYLSNNPIGDASANHLAGLLNTPSCEIYHLALGMDLMTDIGYKNIGDVLASNTTIQYFELDHGRMYRELKDQYSDRVFDFRITAEHAKRVERGAYCCRQQARHTFQNP